MDAFISKLNGDGTGLLCSTYLGGSGSDYGTSIEMDASGNLYLAGQTNSSDFPTTSGAFQETQNGYVEAFVCKIDSNFSSLVYCTYLGGSGHDGVRPAVLVLQTHKLGKSLGHRQPE